MDASVAVPVDVLPARGRVQVDDDEQAGGAAQVDDALEPLEALLEPDAGLLVALKVAVVDGDADRVEAERGKELGVLLAERARLEGSARGGQIGTEGGAATHVKKYSRNRSKKYSYFSSPMAAFTERRMPSSCPGLVASKGSQVVLLISTTPRTAANGQWGRARADALARDEVLHVEHAPEAGALEDDILALVVDDLVALAV